jgi:peptidoglycan/xylan/chitin deacetylase (PgdA/CDA1 family)
MLSTLGRLKRGMADRFVRCLYCHYVFDDQVADFERIILWLKSVGTFVDSAALIDMLTGVRPVDGRYFHLSFDDGFRNNFTNALPILRKHAVPAMFFVPSGLIGADWDRTRDYCLNVTHYRAVIEMMGWNDLEAILDAGYEVGSHTRTHARFSAISSDREHLEDEIRGSKHDLESRLRYRCRFISWPYGRVTDADNSSVDFTREAGYEACFGAFRGTVRPGTTDPYRIPRHHFEPQWPMAHVEYFARGNREAAE